MKYKAIIIDDEAAARENLRLLMENIDPSIVLLEANDIFSGKNLIEEYHPKVIFLDINMPNHNGFDLLEIIDYKNYIVVVVSAHLDYSLQAIKKHVFDFLLKPFGFTTLKDTLNRIDEELKSKGQTLQLSNSRLVFKTKSESFYLKPEEILYCESENNYTTIHLLNGKSILLSKTIKSIDETLQSLGTFLRVHRSYIVNLDFVEKFNSFESTLLLRNNVSIDVSERKRKEFLDIFGRKE